MNQKSTYLSGVKTIHDQSFTILLQTYIQKHPMIIVKTSCEDIDSSMKLSVENSLSVLPLIIRAISHTFSFTNITNILKKVLKNSKLDAHTRRTHISQRSHQNISPMSQQKHRLITFLNRSFFMLRCSKTSLVESKGCTEMEKQGWRYKMNAISFCH